MNKYIWMLLAALSIFACSDIEQPIIEEEVLPALTAGSADFSNYVAVGASFTAGFSDGALFKAGQQNSFPNMLATEFAKIGGGTFSQPLMNDNIGGLVLGSSIIQNPRLYFDGSMPVTLPATPTTDVSNVVSGPFKNMGVPGIKSYHLLVNGYGSLEALALGKANPYFVRMASKPTASVFEDVMAQNPTFFTLSEIGGNDVLGYALAGGDGVDQTGNYDPSTYGPNDITDPVVFKQVYSSIVAALTANGAKGVVTTIPYITSLPHFTTVHYNPLSPLDPDFGPLIPLLNSVYGVLDLALAEAGVPERAITFSTSAASPVVIFDETLENKALDIRDALISSPYFEALLVQFNLPTDSGTKTKVATLLGQAYDQVRQANSGDLLVLSSSSQIGKINETTMTFLMSQGLPQVLAAQFSVNGITFPLEDKWVLLPSEQDDIKTAIDAYNTTIIDVAGANSNVAVVDLRQLLEQATGTGIQFDEFTMTTQLVLGGLVSLDGVHLTARGYALMANKFLEAIDAKFDSNFIEAEARPTATDYNSFYPVSM